MKKIINFGAIVCSILIASCTKVDDSPNGAGKVESAKSPDNTIIINTSRNVGNILGAGSGHATRAMGDDPFTEIREVNSFESVVLPELQPHIWMGNIMTLGSVKNCNYKPLVYPRIPITVSLTLPGTSSQEINGPSYSNFNQYIQEQTDKGSFAQSNEFSFSVEQFTSYHELKAAFGCNVNTNAIFWASSSSSSSTEHLIQKATGLYVNFYQTSYKAIMDYPQGQIASIPDNMIDSTVYINSITYGRLGILTLETNETAFDAQQKINTIFRTIFYNNSTTFTKEEQSFLSGCDFKVYMIGGNGKTAVESFSGLSGFIEHIKKGTFSREIPGQPIFCTFNHVKDNSPVSINFKFNVKKEPIYIELLHKPETIPAEADFKTDVYGHGAVSSLSNYSKIRGWGRLYVKFYRDRAKVPTIAHAALPINVLSKHTCITHYPDGRTEQEVTTKTVEIKNAGQETSMDVGWPYTYYVGGRRGPGAEKIGYDPIIWMYDYAPGKKDRRGQMGPSTEDIYEYSLVGSEYYVILGKPLNQDNCPLSRKDK